MSLAASLLALPAAAQEDGICAPALVTHTPDGTTGEARAVAITAQAVDLEVGSGWVNVAWEVATGVELTAVSVIGTGGDVRTDPDPGPTGSATDVAALVFCGTADLALLPPADTDLHPDPEPDPDTPDEADGDGDEPEPTPPATPDDEEVAPGAGSDTSGSGPSTSAPAPATPPAPSGPSGADGTGTGEAAATDTAAASDTDDADGEVADDPDASDPSEVDPDVDDTEVAPDEQPADPSTEADTDEVADAEVEVLGVQLTQDEGRTGPAWAMLLLVLGLGVLAVGAGVSVWRHWPAR